MADTKEAVAKMIHAFNAAKLAIEDHNAMGLQGEQRIEWVEETIQKFRDAEAEIQNVRAQLVNEWYELIMSRPG